MKPVPSQQQPKVLGLITPFLATEPRALDVEDPLQTLGQPDGVEEVGFLGPWLVSGKCSREPVSMRKLMAAQGGEQGAASNKGRRGSG